jgi:signal transduction histidine kinase
LASHGTLYEQVRLARVWLPLTIVGVVLVHQLLVLPLGSPAFQFWGQVLFFSILGPLATYLTLNWIAGELLIKERQSAELASLYDELRASHELLGSIHEVTTRFAAAPDLETTVDAAAEGIAKVTGAIGVALVVGPGDLGVTHSIGLTPRQVNDVLTRDRLARHEQGGGGAAGVTATRGEGALAAGDDGTVVTAPLVWGGTPEGSVTAYFGNQPDARRLESFNILVAQFSAAAEAARLRTRDLLTLVEVDRSIRAEGNLDRLLVTVLTQMMARVGAAVGGVFLADEEQVLRLSSSVGIPKDGNVRAWRVGEGVVGQVARAREPRILDTLDDLADDSLGPLLKGAGSAVALPLGADDRVLGVVVLAHPEPRHFDGATIPFLGLAAGQVSLAVRNASAYMQSEELAIVEERSRIAREIHDGVAQMLAFSALKLDLVVRLLEGEQPKARAELDQVRSSVRESIKEVRRSIFALRPVDLERHGFVETVKRYALDFGQQNDVKVTLTAHDLPNLSIKSEAVLFRIFQEAMHNVAKHARARSVDVQLGTDAGGMAYVRIVDDGVGFEPTSVSDRVSSAGGLGLRQMRERVAARGGTLVIDTAVGVGTTLFAAVPV